MVVSAAKLVAEWRLNWVFPILYKCVCFSQVGRTPREWPVLASLFIILVKILKTGSALGNPHTSILSCVIAFVYE